MAEDTAHNIRYVVLEDGRTYYSLLDAVIAFDLPWPRSGLYALVRGTGWHHKALISHEDAQEARPGSPPETGKYGVHVVSAKELQRIANLRSRRAIEEGTEPPAIKIAIARGALLAPAVRRSAARRSAARRSAA